MAARAISSLRTRGLSDCGAPVGRGQGVLTNRVIVPGVGDTSIAARYARGVGQQRWSLGAPASGGRAAAAHDQGGARPDTETTEPTGRHLEPVAVGPAAGWAETPAAVDVRARGHVGG